MSIIRKNIKEGLKNFHFNTNLSLELLPKKSKLQLEKASTKIALKKKNYYIKETTLQKVFTFY